MTNSAAHTEDVAQQSNPGDAPPEHGQRVVRRNSPRLGMFKAISFESIAAGVSVRVTDDGHLLALDFLSVLSRGDRKKASQILARITSRSDFSEMLTLRHVEGKQKTRKLVSFSNAIQLLLTLPKRTVSLETRRTVAGVLTDYFEYRHQQQTETNKPPAAVAPNSDPSANAFSQSMNFASQFSSLPSQFSSLPGPFSFYNNNEEDRRIAQRQAHVNLTRHEMELERQRAKLPLERLNQCMELMERCGPMSEEEQRKFRSLITEQAVGGGGSGVRPACV